MLAFNNPTPHHSDTQTIAPLWLTMSPLRPRVRLIYSLSNGCPTGPGITITVSNRHVNNWPNRTRHHIMAWTRQVVAGFHGTRFLFQSTVTYNHRPPLSYVYDTATATVKTPFRQQGVFLLVTIRFHAVLKNRAQH
jgi:hypothetical protein